MKRLRLPLLIATVIIVLFAIGAWLISQGSFAVLSPSGEIARSEKTVLIYAVVLSAIVVLPVFVLLATFAWRYRESNTKAKYEPNFASNNRLEALWWGIPIVLILILSTITWASTHTLDPQKAIASDRSPLEVQVVALQWKWLFIYPEYNVATVNQLPIEVNRPVHFSLSADAPMNGFWIPKLGTQVYAMNGMSMQLNLIAGSQGSYTGYATNINGRGYADMNFQTTAMSRQAFSETMTKANVSPKKLTYESYETLAKPGMKKPETYALKDHELYDKIVAKYMQSMMDTDISESTSNMNHINMHMQGMSH